MHEKMKTGRNEPCPCGSGRKYKRCHLEAEQRGSSVIQVVDATEMRIGYILEQRGASLWQSVNQQADKLQLAVFADYRPSDVLTEEQAEQSLRSWMTAIELELRRIASTNSKRFWFFLFQRLAPSEARFLTSTHTVQLYRQILKLATLKHGADVGTAFTVASDRSTVASWILGEVGRLPMTTSDDGQAIPESLTEEDVRNAMLLERLSYDYWSATSMLRRVWKGGKLPIDENGAPDNPLHGPEAEWLIDLYDERLQYSRILSRLGSIETPEMRLGPDSLPCLIVQHNWEKHELPTLLFHNPGQDANNLFQPRYLIRPSDAAGLYRKASLFRSDLTAALGVDPLQLLLYLAAISARQMRVWREIEGSELQVWQRGYAVITSGDEFPRDVSCFYQGLAHQWGSELSYEEAEVLVREAEAWFTYAADLSAIDLWTRTGTRLILRDGDIRLIDFSAVVGVLHNLFEPLASLGGTAGALKGHDFESEVAGLIEREVAEARIEWKNLVVGKGTDKHRELDIGVSKGGVLFVADCKANNVAPAFDRGDPQAIFNREEILRRNLRSVDSAARMLAEDPPEGFSLPPAVQAVVGVVIGPFPEYIPERGEAMFLEERVPRVVTPEEFVQFLSACEVSEVIKKTWCYRRA